MQTEKEVLQQRYMELQMLNQQIKQYQKQLQLFENQLMDLISLDKSLDDLNKTETGTDILASLGSGVFVKAGLKDNNELIVNVGSNIAVEKDIPATKELINKQAEELGRLLEQGSEGLQRTRSQARAVEQEISKTTSKKENV